MLALVLLGPELGSRLRPEPPAPSAAATARPAAAVPADVLDRLERNMAREHAAHYLSEAQDVLLSVAATEADCDRTDGRIDVGEAPDRSRDLLARRALMVEGRPEAVASARAVLDEVELALREVADLPVVRPPPRRAAPAPGHRAAAAAHADPPDDEGARGMKQLVSALALVLSPSSRRRGGRRVTRRPSATRRRSSSTASTRRPATRGGRSAPAAGARRGAPCTGSPAAARSSGESARALEEYGEYLDSRPSDRTLREEATTSRVALAAKLYKAGKTRHLDVLQGALDDSSRTVRYFAALQMASLGPKVGRPAVPVLQQILKTETDPDLVERAKLALLRLDRTALAEASPAPRAARRPAGSGCGSGRRAGASPSSR